MDTFCYLCFMFVFGILPCLSLATLLSPAWYDVFLCFVTFPYGVLGQV